MNCFNEEKIQQYLDDECNKDEKGFFTRHVETCHDCKAALSKQQQRKAEVKQSLELLVTEQTFMPQFRAPEKATEKKMIAVRFLIPVAIAAGLLLFLLVRPFINADKPPINGQNVQFVISEEFDANKPVKDHPIIMTVVAPDGTVTQSTIN